MFAAHHRVVDSLCRETVDESRGIAREQNAMRGNLPQRSCEWQRINAKVLAQGIACDYAFPLQVFCKMQVLHIGLVGDMLLCVIQQEANAEVHMRCLGEDVSVSVAASHTEVDIHRVLTCAH